MIKGWLGAMVFGSYGACISYEAYRPYAAYRPYNPIP